MKPRLLIIGAGGHARVVISIARRMGTWDLIGVLAREAPTAYEQIDGVPLIGPYADAARLHGEGVTQAALAIGDNTERASKLAGLAQLGFNFPVLQHPSALIEDNATLGDGTVVCAGAIIGAQVMIGRNVIINTGAILDHETVVGDHAHIAPGCRVAGRVRIGEGTLLGIGTCVREKIDIGAQSLIGAGSVVVDDIPGAVVAYGCPARVARSLQP